MVHTIWSGGKSALLFATAKPPRSGRILIFEFCFYSFTSATVGGLTTAFYRQWGKTQDLPQLTASAAIARQLGSEDFDLVIMVDKHLGGRGYAYEICASYKIAGSKLKRFDLE